jgi:hypothetical protein
MKIANTLFATVAILALAGPAFAQSVTFTTASTGQTATQTDVTATIDKACVITQGLSAFTVTVTPNGEVTAPAPKSVTVVCNTPSATLKLGSNNMVNTTAPAILPADAGTFTNVILFNALADDFGNETFLLDSRAITTTRSSASSIGLGGNRRIRTMQIGLDTQASGFIARPLDNKKPVAGDYRGAICLTVDPSGMIPGSTGLPNNDEFCAAAAAAAS